MAKPLSILVPFGTRESLTEMVAEAKAACTDSDAFCCPEDAEFRFAVAAPWLLRKAGFREL